MTVCRARGREGGMVRIVGGGGGGGGTAECCLGYQVGARPVLSDA
jgi:hypothetical protein